jgi:hypothetical protein
MSDRLAKLSQQLAAINQEHSHDLIDLAAQRGMEIRESLKSDLLKTGAASFGVTMGATAMLVTATATPLVFATALTAGALLAGKLVYDSLRLNLGDHYQTAMEQIRKEVAGKPPEAALSATAGSLLGKVWGAVRSHINKPAAPQQATQPTPAVGGISEWRRRAATTSIASAQNALGPLTAGIPLSTQQQEALLNAVDQLAAATKSLDAVHFEPLTAAQGKSWVDSLSEKIASLRQTLQGHQELQAYGLVDTLATSQREVRHIASKLEKLHTNQADNSSPSIG